MTFEKVLGRKDASIAILREKENILCSWEDLARAGVPAANVQSKTQLRDSLPVFIDQLAKTLSCANPAEEAVLNAEVAQEHADDRLKQGDYSLDEMIFEYGILRGVLIDFLDTVGRFDLPTRQVLHSFMDRGIRKAAVEFARVESERKLKQIEEMNLLRETEVGARRTAELANRQLLDSKNELRAFQASEKERLDSTIQSLQEEKKLRERFIAAITHDLRTPLTSAKMGAQLIERKPGNLNVVEATAKRIVSSMNRADQMIRDLLDADRIKAGEGYPLALDSCYPEIIARDAVKELSDIYGARIELSADLLGEECFWDSQGIRRVIENLVNNAVKYGDRNTRIAVILKQEKSSIQISVHNEGKAIAAADFGRIFEPYGRTSSAQLGNQIGWGVGLTLVKGIVEAHGGSVWVESAEKFGTTFFVKLPLDARKKL